MFSVAAHISASCSLCVQGIFSLNYTQQLIGRTDAEAPASALATGFKEPTQWKRPLCWERLRAGGEGGDRG